MGDRRAPDPAPHINRRDCEPLALLDIFWPARYICCTANMAYSQNIYFEEELLLALKEELEHLPGVKMLRQRAVKERKADAAVDAVFSISVQGRPIRVLFEAKQYGFPRDVLQFTRQLRNIKAHAGDVETVQVVAAPSISPGSRDLLRAQGIGYFDSGGSLYLPLRNGVYFVDKPAPGGDRPLGSIYKGRSAQVLHVLLARHDHRWHVNELAEEAGVSPYTVHRVVTSLEKQLWIEKRGKGPESIRTLREPGALLDAWARTYSTCQFEFRNYYRWSQSFATLRQIVAEGLAGAEYALTLASGAELTAPFATSVDRLHLIVPATVRLDDVVRRAELKPVDSGANVTFMLTRQRSPLLLRRSIDGIWVASDIQLYLDLWNSPARGKEQAEHLRKQRLHF
jgi:hypothetical protein